MTHCNRCGNDFENFFNGMHWCVFCGKQFALDMNLFSKPRKEKEDKEEERAEKPNRANAGAGASSQIA